MRSSSDPSRGPRTRRPNRAVRSTYDRALDLLEARARSVVELRRALIKKGEPAADVDAAIERLRAAGLLDDASYARQLARSKALGAGQSRRRIAQELGRRGVARTVGDEAIAAVFDEEAVDEDANIDRVARKKMKTLAKLDARVQRRRLYAFLARRGYEVDAISDVVGRLTGLEARAE
jgi:regulatory protein